MITMVYNANSITNKNKLDVSLVSLGNVALAQSEGGSVKWGLETYLLSYDEYTNAEGCTWKYWEFDCANVQNPHGCEPGFEYSTSCS